ncbi:methylenetetrahydrofolate reductase [Corynebacterium sp. zg-331]|uniref:methylenetetrahydrofolate reductase n=1 Tax=unclassified Corynebacterium TaxID=2624378 RepID=UPI00128E761B|nr:MULTISPECIES: methylenetetrahydrofolate reductase [unclassified Corynebacterium]MBC3185530.1 methylenetetrahydrofolate reductase [Corynebacterium sp. zg-331]MPV52024.1 5,10-methylenetetrahydrofolate reductase [Corynebacterium sp. zg331]
MSTAHLYIGYRPGVRTDTPTVSFELYPPRNPSRGSGVWAGIGRLIDTAPDYVSVTYGAAGKSTDTRDRSVQVLLNVLDRHRDLPAVAHLTCLGSTREELTLLVRLLLRAGIRDFLALRGDPPGGDPHYQPPRGGPTRAVDLVRLIREIAAEELPLGVGRGYNGAGAATAARPEDYVSIAVAAYPATGGQARANDIAALVEKERAGADYAITQVFYSPEDYASMVRELSMVGSRLPIVPGIMPLHDLNRLRTMEKLAGIAVPERIERIFSQATSPERLVRDTLGATVDLIGGVLEAGAPGIHLYTFNRPRPTLDILEYLRASGYLGRTTGARTPGDPHVDTELVSLALRRMTPNYY